MKRYNLSGDDLIINLPDEVDPADFVNNVLFDAMLAVIKQAGGDMASGFDLVEMEMSNE